MHTLLVVLAVCLCSTPILRRELPLQEKRASLIQ